MAAILICSGSLAATIKVTTDRNPVGLNESFTMTFESEASVDGDPDFSPLNRNFQILSRNSSSNMSIINGRISSSKKWQLTLLARHAGKLIIPVIHFGKDASQASFVDVTSGKAASATAKSGQDVFIEVGVEPQHAYVQAEIIYTVRLFLAVATANASLSEPGVNGASAVIERLGEDRNYQTSRGGKRYNVVERKYAIYPQVSGKMTIEPVMFQGQINRSAFSLFDPFGPQPRTVVERSLPVTLDIKPVPDAFPGGHWIPARKVTLTESWSQNPPVFKVGEPITRTLTLLAEGQTASQLLELPEWIPAAFKKYPDQPILHDDKREHGVTASRQEKVAIIPNRAGDYLLPEIKVPWWNTRTNKLEYARLPARKIRVAPALPDNTSTMTGLPAGGQKNIVPQTGETTVPEVKGSASGNSSGPAGGFWQGLSAGLALAWIITLVLWWRSRARSGIAELEDRKDMRLKQVIREIEQACTRDDPDKLKTCLLQWGQQVWPDSPPTSLGEIGRRAPAVLTEKIEQLNNILYSQRKESWDGHEFWLIFKASHAASRRRQKQHQGELEPLYRL